MYGFPVQKAVHVSSSGSRAERFRLSRQHSSLPGISLMGGSMAGPSTVWKGYVSFGLVTFPVRLFSAARPEAVHFHMLHKKDLSRVKEVWYCAEEDKPIERSEIVKGYATRDDEYVVVDKKELDAVAPPTATTMDIVQFVESAEVD